MPVDLALPVPDWLIRGGKRAPAYYHTNKLLYLSCCKILGRYLIERSAIPGII